MSFDSYQNPRISNASVKVFSQALILTILLLPTWLLSAMAEDRGQAQDVKCDVHHGACTKHQSGLTVTLDINPKPVKAMKELTFTVTLSGVQPPANPSIDLGMPGMKMGPNRVLLKRVSEGKYEGVGIIVRCPSGHRTWRAKVTVPYSGTVDFDFDAIY